MSSKWTLQVLRIWGVLWWWLNVVEQDAGEGLKGRWGQWRVENLKAWNFWLLLWPHPILNIPLYNVLDWKLWDTATTLEKCAEWCSNLWKKWKTTNPVIPFIHHNHKRKLNKKSNSNHLTMKHPFQCFIKGLVTLWYQDQVFAGRPHYTADTRQCSLKDTWMLANPVIAGQTKM